IAHRMTRHAGPLRQLLCDPGRVGAALLDLQEQLLALAAGLEAEVFVHLEILDLHTQLRGQHGITVGAKIRRVVRGFGAHSPPRRSRTTACAAMPSPRPVKPSRSLVVALTLTAPTGMPRSSAMHSRMAMTCGASFGRSQTTTLSRLPTCMPCSATMPATCRSITRLSASFQRGSPGGKCW